MSAESASDAAGGASRRSFLKSAAAVGATMLAPGVVLYAVEPSQAAPASASAKVRWGLLVDLNKCPRDCRACVTACGSENGLKTSDLTDTDPQWIRKVAVTDPASGVRRDLPVMCQHCAKPACVDVCPTGASFKRADGIVLVDKHICIGCRYCIMACPYKGRSFVHAAVEPSTGETPRGKGTVESCTLCVHRIDAGRIPACVEACAAKGGGAMLFGDLNDAGSDIAKAVKAHGSVRIRPDLGLEPAIHYLNL